MCVFHYALLNFIMNIDQSVLISVILDHIAFKVQLLIVTVAIIVTANSNIGRMTFELND